MKHSPALGLRAIAAQPTPALSTPRTWGPLATCLGATLLIGLGSCGGAEDPPVEPQSAGAQVAGAGDSASLSAGVIARQDLIAALFAEERYQDALAILEPLIQTEAPMAWDLIAAGILEASKQFPDEKFAKKYFLRAYEIAPDSPVINYNLGQLEFSNGTLEASLEYYLRAHALAPRDLPTELALSQVYEELEQYGLAEKHLLSLQKVGLDYSGSWYRTILYRLSQMMSFSEREEQHLALELQINDLEDRGISAPTNTDIKRGNFGRILPPTPIANNGIATAPLPTFAPGVSLGFPAGLTGITAFALNEHWVKENDDGEPAFIGTTDWLAWGQSGVFTRSADGEVNTISKLPVQLLRGVDIEQLFTKVDHIEGDGDGDFMATSGKQLHLFQNVQGEWTSRIVFEFREPPADLCLTDFDHEGDLDVLAVGPFGLTLLRNDGVHTEDGVLTDVTSEAGLDIESPLSWCLAEDLDTDQDVDFLVGSHAGVHQGDNLRGGNFLWKAGRTEGLPAGDIRPLVADRDGDARPDLQFGDGRCFLGRGDGSWKANLDAPKGRPLGLLGDVDLNGDTDGIAIGAGELVVWSGLAEARPLGVEAIDPVDSWGALTDANGDGTADLVVLRGGEATLHVATAPTTPAASSFRLALRGIKDNRRAVGAIVEIRTGPIYRRIYWRGEPTSIGMAGSSTAEVVRITWPNGVVQSVVNHEAGVPMVLHQKKGLIGSCPFLYSWNGETFTFISDVLGITPLGLPMAPGMMVPPDHDEFVLVTGEQLVPRDIDGGTYYDLQFTEELREVTYLDRVRLDVVDHPIGSEIFPDERFCFPPFPAEHTHLTVAPKGPDKAMQVAYDGSSPNGTHLLGEAQTERDWAAELAQIDGQYAAPFVHYTGRFQGLAPMHALELSFDPETVAAGGELRLFMTGWFFWTDASVNMAAARTPGVEFMPPLLQVPDGEGGWRDLGPPVGFPAGKTKTMVIDVAGQLDPADPRLRVVSTLRLYWDSIRLGIDENAAGDAPLIVTPIELDSALLWERGFSRAIPMAGQDDLEWFEWDAMESEPRWNQHPGLYTRHGEVDELLHVADDMFAILGAGDSLRLRFDAELAPPLKQGYRRDFLLYLDGWAKDRDPNSIEAKFVEPLPFHGMSSYPYGADEHFPDGPVHQAWRAEWNTRSAKRWIVPLGNS